MTAILYRMERYITPEEIKESALYGSDDKEMFFDMLEFSGPRKGEYRVSIGQGRWASMWVTPLNDILALETSYLEQEDVEEILQTFAHTFRVRLKQFRADGLISSPLVFEPRPYLRLVN